MARCNSMKDQRRNVELLEVRVKSVSEKPRFR